MVDKGAEVVGGAVGAMHGEQLPGVVPPAVRVLRQRHDLDSSEVEVHDVLEPLLGGGKGALRGEAADVHLVNHRVFQRSRQGAIPFPIVIVGIDHHASQ